MAYNQFLKMMIIFSVAFITVLILKVSGPCPLAWGWGGGEAVLPQTTPRRLFAGREGCLPLPHPLLLAPYSSPPRAALLSLLGILGTTQSEEVDLQ